MAEPVNEEMTLHWRCGGHRTAEEAVVCLREMAASEALPIAGRLAAAEILDMSGLNVPRPKRGL